jgi:peptide-methionine (S)-S-oxide reductase
MLAPLTPGIDKVMFGMGCFWGVERMFWEINGVTMTAVGYSGGAQNNPTYETVCSGKTGHSEVVLVNYDSTVVSFSDLLKVFWEGHNPTQGMRQGNDFGSQYRSCIYTFSHYQYELANLTGKIVSDTLKVSGVGSITTEILRANEFYYAEKYHQQYLAKNRNGYCGLGGMGISFNFENVV